MAELANRVSGLEYQVGDCDCASWSMTILVILIMLLIWMVHVNKRVILLKVIMRVIMVKVIMRVILMLIEHDCRRRC